MLVKFRLDSEAASLEKHVLLKKLRDALQSLKGRVAGRNKDDVAEAIAMADRQLVVLFCLYSILLGRNQLKDQLLSTLKESNAPAIPLLEVLVLLIDPKLPWSCKIVGSVSQNNAFGLLREIILTAKLAVAAVDRLRKDIRETTALAVISLFSKVITVECNQKQKNLASQYKSWTKLGTREDRYVALISA
ncbi:hypothetical protein Fmac_017493 [Flemingia macrophylla]|uniref:Stomatal closure-related actin-binding protein coiled-coil domain-containing protein n=1 Tax=Flemingia macrophylla TaxID=520843 RepID=A0ABD1M2P9_9FABA